MSDINNEEKSQENEGLGNSKTLPEEFVHSFNSGIIQKSDYFDLFISYKRDNGGDHGQKLAIELHEKLTKDGYKVWLDNYEIGFSSNFEQRIEEALLHSKKVACVIGPGWVESTNCRYEVKLAIEFEKRIIPIHYQEFRELLQSKKELGELTLDEWNRIDKPQELDFSNKSKYRKGYEDLKAVCDLHDNITEEHTRILCESYYWKKYNSPKSMLPYGTFLTKAKLLRSKCNSDDELPTFTADQDEFIAAADKFVSSEVSHHRQAYIAYSKEEYEFASELNIELKLQGIFTWFENLGDEDDRSFVEPIINCDNLISIVREDTLHQDDVKTAYARSNNKRVIQVTDSLKLLNAEREAGVKNIYLWNQQVRIDDLITTINGDAVYNAAHAMLLQKAFEWEKSEKNNNKLLALKEANSAKEWYQLSEKNGTEPQPNLSMVNFVERSVAYADTLRKRKIGLLWTAILGAILIIALGWSAFSLKQSADKEQAKVVKATENLNKAKAKLDSASEDLKNAQTKVLDAEKQVEDAEKQVWWANRKVAGANKKVEEAKLKVEQANKKVADANVKVVDANKAVEDASEKVAEANEKVVDADKKVEVANKKEADAQKQLDRTKLKTDAAKLSLAAYELTLDGNYSAAKENADLAVALYDQIDDEDYETDILYNTYYSILSKTKLDPKDAEFKHHSTVTASSIQMDHCAYVGDNDFDWKAAKQIEKDTSLVYSLVYSDKGNFGALGLKSGKIILFNPSTHEILDEVSVGTYRVTSMDFNSSGSQLVASTVNGKFIIIPLEVSSGIRNPKKQLIRRESFARIEEIEFVNDNTIRAVGGVINDSGVMTKTYQKYPATVKKLTEIIGI